jgi:hypothetical protein
MEEVIPKLIVPPIGKCGATTCCSIAQKRQRNELIIWFGWTACLQMAAFTMVQGELMKKFDMRDGMGLEILRQHQVEVIVMTSKTPIWLRV